MSDDTRKQGKPKKSNQETIGDLSKGQSTNRFVVEKKVYA